MLYQIEGKTVHHPFNLIISDNIRYDQLVSITGRFRRVYTYEERLRPTTTEDCDLVFIAGLTRFSPSYVAEDFLEYHFSQTDYEPYRWLKHIEYEILPYKVFEKKPHLKKLVLEWIEQKKEQLKNGQYPPNFIIQKALAEAKLFKEMLNGDFNEIQKNYIDKINNSLEAIPLASKSLYLNTFINQINIFLAEHQHLCVVPGDCLFEKKWNEAKDWAQSQLNLIESSLKMVGAGPSKSEIKWKDSKAGFIELVYALMESGAISYNKKEVVVMAFSKFLNFEIKNPDQTLQGIKAKRNSDNKTIFLDKLKKAFTQYINKEE